LIDWGVYYFGYYDRLLFFYFCSKIDPASAGSINAPAEIVGTGNHLNQIRLNLTYFYRNTYGLNLGWQDTWGNANPALFAPKPVSGSANGKPNSNSFIIEADWVPFGKDNSWGVGETRGLCHPSGAATCPGIRSLKHQTSIVT
jgi:hypothetical protein